MIYYWLFFSVVCRIYEGWLSAFVWYADLGDYCLRMVHDCGWLWLILVVCGSCNVRLVGVRGNF